MSSISVSVGTGGEVCRRQRWRGAFPCDADGEVALRCSRFAVGSYELAGVPPLPTGRGVALRGGRYHETRTVALVRLVMLWVDPDARIGEAGKAMLATPLTWKFVSGYPSCGDVSFQKGVWTAPDEVPRDSGGPVVT